MHNLGNGMVALSCEELCENEYAIKVRINGEEGYVFISKKINKSFRYGKFHDFFLNKTKAVRLAFETEINRFVNSQMGLDQRR